MVDGCEVFSGWIKGWGGEDGSGYAYFLIMVFFLLFLHLAVRGWMDGIERHYHPGFFFGFGIGVWSVWMVV